jgi:hypothetical protein
MHYGMPEFVGKRHARPAVADFRQIVDAAFDGDDDFIAFEFGPTGHVAKSRVIDDIEDQFLIAALGRNPAGL